VNASGCSDHQTISSPRGPSSHFARKIVGQVYPFQSLSHYKLSRVKKKKVADLHEMLIVVAFKAFLIPFVLAI
jgi:hypothetical protein